LKFQPTLKKWSGRRGTRLQKLAALRNLYLCQDSDDCSWENIGSMFRHVVEWERWVFHNVECANPESITVELLMVAIQQRVNISDEITSVCDFWREGVDPQSFTVKES
jgi:hypothetical protein